MSETRAQCSSCAAVLRLNSAIPAGKSVKCPKCGSAVRVPESTEETDEAPREQVVTKPAKAAAAPLIMTKPVSFTDVEVLEDELDERQEYDNRSLLKKLDILIPTVNAKSKATLRRGFPLLFLGATLYFTASCVQLVTALISVQNPLAGLSAAAWCTLWKWLATFILLVSVAFGLRQARRVLGMKTMTWCSCMLFVSMVLGLLPLYFALYYLRTGKLELEFDLTKEGAALVFYPYLVETLTWLAIAGFLLAERRLFKVSGNLDTVPMTEWLFLLSLALLGLKLFMGYLEYTLLLEVIRTKQIGPIKFFMTIVFILMLIQILYSLLYLKLLWSSWEELDVL